MDNNHFEDEYDESYRENYKDRNYKSNNDELNESYYSEKYNYARKYEELVETDELKISKEILDDEIMHFDKMGDPSLKDNLLRGIYAYGFEAPSPIQQKAIKPLIQKRDIIAQAQSGTGKTATFAIGALASIDLSSNTTQVLVLSPTKELTIQTAAVFKAISQFMTGLRIQLMYGGSVIEEGSSFSSRNVPHIICGCPGRVYDMMRRDKISSKKIKLVILDEADKMIDLELEESVNFILESIPV